MGDTGENERELSESDARTLRFLRGLVLVLTVTMIVGMAALVALFAIRFSGRDTPAPSAGQGLVFPDTLALPEGAEPQAVTQGAGWWAIVTTAGEILIFDADSGALRQRVEIE
ncbi:DUF6476 family protein [Tropicimonas marinistellae]|uniref:DUF6476 family protein n=1 Tax=Tropicimonas marinistellae TaxID=1739787 RepID=UPI0008301B0E|nr:DUF6476 family protein [Tropicimonas marinistellae]